MKVNNGDVQAFGWRSLLVKKSDAARARRCASLFAVGGDVCGSKDRYTRGKSAEGAKDLFRTERACVGY